MTAADPAVHVFSFGTGRRAGIALGMTVAQALAAGAGVALTISLLTGHAPLPLALGAGLALALPGLVPVGGRPAVAWLAPAATRLRTRPAVMPLEDAVAVRPSRRIRLARPLFTLTLGQVASALGPLGTATTPANWAVALELAPPPGYGSADTAEQARVLTQLGTVLDRLAHLDAVRAVRWLEHTATDDSETAVTGSCHLLLELDARSEPGRAAEAAETAASGLAAAGAAVRGLDTNGVTALIARTLTGTRSPALPGPLAVSVRPAWDHVRIDDTLHRAFAVAGWPPGLVGPGWLHPLLGASTADASRSIGVRCVAVPAAVAARRARAARAGAELDETDRARLGLGASAADTLAAGAATDLEADVVAGHAAHHVSAVLAVHAADHDALDAASRQLASSAAGLRMRLLPLHGQHTQALAWLLPGGPSR